MSATQAIRDEIDRRRQKISALQAQIRHLEQTLTMLDEGAGAPAVVKAAATAVPVAEVRPLEVTGRNPAWFLPAQIIFSDGAPHSVSEVLEAVKEFDIDRKAVGVWLSRRTKKGILKRKGPGMYQLAVDGRGGVG